MPTNKKNTHDIEEIIAHHEHAIEVLSKQLSDQWTIIREMQNKLDVLTKRFVTLEENALPAPAITKPPHY